VPHLFEERGIQTDAAESAGGLLSVRLGDGVRAGCEHDRGCAAVPHKARESGLLGVGGPDGGAGAEAGLPVRLLASADALPQHLRRAAAPRQRPALPHAGPTSHARVLPQRLAAQPHEHRHPHGVHAPGARPLPEAGVALHLPAGSHLPALPQGAPAVEQGRGGVPDVPEHAELEAARPGVDGNDRQRRPPPHLIFYIYCYVLSPCWVILLLDR
jgi:hypothetical protein